MGWGRTFLLGDLGNQLDIRDTRRALAGIAAQLRATGRFDHEVARRLDELAAENAELKLYLASIVRLLVAKGLVSPDELKAIVDAVDASDGRTDGQFDGAIAPK